MRRSTGFLGALLLGLLLTAAVAGAAHARTAAADSLSAPAWRWTAVPARTAADTVAFRQPPRPDWEAALMPVYYVLGVPFRILGWAGNGAVTGLDKLGVFNLPPSEYPGLPGPFGTYLMPVFAIESLEGTKIGIDVLRPHFFGRDNLLRVKATTTTRKAQMAGAGALFPMGEAWDLQVGGGSEEIQTVRYYGLGHDSFYGDRSYYYRRANWGGLELDRSVGAGFGLELCTFWSMVRARESRYETDQSLDVIHGDDLPPGYPGESSGWTFRLALKRDTTGQRARPDRGSFGSAALDFFHESDASDMRFLRYRLEYERFVPLWHTGRTLAVRGFFNRIVNQGSAEVPFTRMVTFSAPDELRGFQSMRFYGLGSLGVSLEYRWPIWNSRNRDGPGLDAYLFSDDGQVFMGSNDIAMSNLQFTGGAGLRLLGDEGKFTARFEVGWSDEEPVYRLKFNQNFQDNRRVLFDVKDPTRYR